jgi:hypothetical protein
MNRKSLLTPHYWAMACLAMTLTLHTPHEVRAEDTHTGIFPLNMVGLIGAVAVGGERNLVLMGGNINEPFIVPENKALVLTDLVFSPQEFPSRGDFQIQVLPAGGPFSTTLTLFASAADPSSLQVNLTSGLVFRSGSAVKVSLPNGSTSLAVSAFGYLVRTR